MAANVRINDEQVWVMITRSLIPESLHSLVSFPACCFEFTSFPCFYSSRVALECLKNRFRWGCYGAEEKWWRRLMRGSNVSLGDVVWTVVLSFKSRFKTKNFPRQSHLPVFPAERRRSHVWKLPVGAGMLTPLLQRTIRTLFSNIAL